MLVTQVDLIRLSVAVLIALLFTLIALVIRLRQTPATSTGDRVITDGAFGLYLGWVCVAVCANIAAAGAAAGLRSGPVLATWMAVAVVAVARGVGVWPARWSRAGTPVAAAVAHWAPWPSV